jgi:hypothetical protein
MPKKCQSDGCKNDVFSHNYCKRHQYLRKDKDWLKTVLNQQKKVHNKPIRPISNKRRKQLIEYEQAKQEKITELKAENKWFCFICGMPFGEEEVVDCHHTNNRQEDSVFDKKYLVFVHRHCHTAYHNDTYSRLSANRWYNSFVERLKEIDPELYNKELKKKDK